MAGPLTWRNVDAPNFSPAFEGLRTASQLLGNATRSGQELVGQFTQARSDAADRAILNRSLGVQDSADFSRGLRDGSIVGPDMANASLATLRGLDSRVGALLDRDVTRQAYDQTGYTNQRGREGDALLDTAGPQLNQAILNARLNNQAGVQAALSSPEVRALRPGQFATAVTGADTTSVGSQARRNSDYNFDETVTNDDDTRTATNALTRVLRNSADMPSATQNIEQEISRLSPGAASRLIRMAAERGYNVYAPGAPGGAPSGAAVPATGAPAGGAATAGGTAGGGDYGSYLVSLESGGNPEARAKTSSATGLHQFTRDTWLGTVRQANPAWARGMSEADILAARTDPARSAEMEGVLRGNNTRRLQNANVPVNNHNLYAMHHFNPQSGINFARASNSTPMSELISADELKANPYLNGLTKGEAVANWDARAGGASAPGQTTPRPDALARATSAAQVNTGANLAGQLIQETASQNLAGSNFANITELQGDRREPLDVAGDLVAEGGKFAGTERRLVLDEINKLIQQSGRGGAPRINAAQAGQLLSSQVDDVGSPFWNSVNAVPRFAADVAFGYTPRLVNRGLTALADVVGAGGVIPDAIRTSSGLRDPANRPEQFAGGIRPNQKRVTQALNDYLNGNNTTQLAAQNTLGTVEQIRAQAQNTYNAAEAEYQAMVARAQIRPQLQGRAEVLRQQRDAAEQALRRVSQSIADSDTSTPRHDRSVATTRGATGSW